MVLVEMFSPYCFLGVLEVVGHFCNLPDRNAGKRYLEMASLIT